MIARIPSRRPLAHRRGSPPKPHPFATRTAVAVLVGFATGALLGGAPGAALATAITVTTTEDELADDGDCSLRGAIRAANLNAAQDACPAGSGTERDVITLADGATYALTLSGTESLSAAGDLNVNNNPGTGPDLLIQVANDGSATISQDAAIDDRVLAVAANADVELRDVTLRGGSTGGNGGGINVGSGGALKLVRCSIVDNASSALGGGVFNAGSLVAEETFFLRNASTGFGGGGLFNANGATANVTGSRFEENLAIPQSGGGIRNTGKLIVSGTAFVSNVATNTGGAVVNSGPTIDAVEIDASCFVGNSDVAVDTFVALGQTAVGSWWGKSSGPSGGFTGGGDQASVKYDVSGFATAPLAACRPLQLALNHRFELDDDANHVPDRWKLRRLDAGTDGTSCSGSNCVLQMNGDGQRNQALQNIDASGDAGDTVSFSVGSTATAAPATTGRYIAELQLIHADGSRQSRRIKFSRGTHGFETKTRSIVAAEPFVRLKVLLEYGLESGVATFDDVSVVLE
ncbi:CSLREA domain-containing protein [Candidatus Binatia bacterium]|nr:CSLREA domain-containing protein [Candidatus Binatia bacterium]